MISVIERKWQSIFSIYKFLVLKKIHEQKKNGRQGMKSAQEKERESGRRVSQKRVQNRLNKRHQQGKKKKEKDSCAKGGTILFLLV